MSQEILGNGNSGLEARSKINNNFSELYQADTAIQATFVDYVKIRSNPIATLDDDNRIERIDYSDGAYKELTWTDGLLTRRDLVVDAIIYRRDITYDANGLFSSASDSVIS